VFLPCTYVFCEEKIQQAFMALFITLMKNYRQSLVPRASLSGNLNEEHIDMDQIFRKKDFIENCDREYRVRFIFVHYNGAVLYLPFPMSYIYFILSFEKK
jgi:hypothetical protein